MRTKIFREEIGETLKYAINNANTSLIDFNRENFYSPIFDDFDINYEFRGQNLMNSDSRINLDTQDISGDENNADKNQRYTSKSPQSHENAIFSYDSFIGDEMVVDEEGTLPVAENAILDDGVEAYVKNDENNDIQKNTEFEVEKEISDSEIISSDFVDIEDSPIFPTVNALKSRANKSRIQTHDMRRIFAKDSLDFFKNEAQQNLENMSNKDALVRIKAKMMDSMRHENWSTTRIYLKRNNIDLEE